MCMTSKIHQMLLFRKVGKLEVYITTKGPFGEGVRYENVIAMIVCVRKELC